jgi:hypothetical protein
MAIRPMAIRTVVCSAIGSAVAIFTATLSGSMQRAIAQNLVHISQVNNSIIQQSSNSSQTQTTVIDIDSPALRTPHVLKVSAPVNTKLSGRILINGKVIQQFGNQGISLNLSPYLSRGKQTIEISGRYTPAQSSMQVNFSGAGTQVSQQTGGNGVLKQTWVINVH